MIRHDRTILDAAHQLAFGYGGDYCRSCGVEDASRDDHSPDCPARVIRESLAALVAEAHVVKKRAAGRTQYDPAAEAFARARAKALAICRANAAEAKKRASEAKAADWPIVTAAHTDAALAHMRDAEAIAAMEDSH